MPAIAVDRAMGKPLYRQIYDGYREAIVERRLRGVPLVLTSKSATGRLHLKE